MAIKKANIIDPQVLGDFLDVKLVDAIKLTPVVMVDQTLVGKPGSKLELPKYNYIGDAEDVAEGEAMTPASLQASTEEVAIKKAGKYIEITDESKLSAYGDLVAEVGNQLLTSIASKIEKDLYAELRKATKEVQAQAFDKDVVADALAEFALLAIAFASLFESAIDLSKALCLESISSIFANNLLIIVGNSSADIF